MVNETNCIACFQVCFPEYINTVGFRGIIEVNICAAVLLLNTIVAPEKYFLLKRWPSVDLRFRLFLLLFLVRFALEHWLAEC